MKLVRSEMGGEYGENFDDVTKVRQGDKGMGNMKKTRQQGEGR